MVNLECGKQYFIHGRYNTTFKWQVQIFFNTKSPLEYSIFKMGFDKTTGEAFLCDKLAVRYMTHVQISSVVTFCISFLKHKN